MVPPTKRRKISNKKQGETETPQRPQRQAKSTYRRNNLEIVNNEGSNREIVNNEGSHTSQVQSMYNTNEQLQSIPPRMPAIDYTLLAREIIKQQGLMNSCNSSAGDQTLNDSHNTVKQFSDVSRKC